MSPYRFQTFPWKAYFSSCNLYDIMYTQIPQPRNPDRHLFSVTNIFLAHGEIADRFLPGCFYPRYSAPESVNICSRGIAHDLNYFDMGQLIMQSWLSIFYKCVLVVSQIKPNFGNATSYNYCHHKSMWNMLTALKQICGECFVDVVLIHHLSMVH